MGLGGVAPLIGAMPDKVLVYRGGMTRPAGWTHPAAILRHGVAVVQ
jgi:hypothetical protein